MMKEEPLKTETQTITKSRLGITVAVTWNVREWDQNDADSIIETLDCFIMRLLKILPKRKLNLSTMRIPRESEIENA